MGKTSGEQIEELTKKVEQQKFYIALSECKTLDDFKELTEKYKILCENQS